MVGKGASGVTPEARCCCHLLLLLLQGEAFGPRKFLRMGKSAMEASIICVCEAVVGDLGRDKIPTPELLWRRPLFTSFWMSRTVRFTGKGIPSCKMTDRIVAT